MIDPQEEAKLLADWGEAPTKREINLDVHVGAAIQKPAAGYEHLLARKRAGWRSFDELKTAVEAAYPKGSQGRKIEERDDGIYRAIKGHTGETVLGEDGRLQVGVFTEWVPVAMSQRAARVASNQGVRTDYFNGFSWVGRGVKVERDMNTMAHVPGGNPNRELSFEPADDATQARHLAALSAVAATASRFDLTRSAPKSAEKPAAAKKGD